jgi:hypothetical protein
MSFIYSLAVIYANHQNNQYIIVNFIYYPIVT